MNKEIKAKQRFYVTKRKRIYDATGKFICTTLLRESHQSIPSVSASTGIPEEQIETIWVDKYSDIQQEERTMQMIRDEC